MGKRWTTGTVVALISFGFKGPAALGWIGDFDESGYVDLVDYQFFG